MGRFLLRRAVWLALTLLAVLTLSFALVRAARGGPFDGERALPIEVERELAARYHLDWPLWKQYLGYLGPLNLDERGARFLGGDGTRVLGGVLAGDFGPSMRYRDLTVNEILRESLPVSLALGALALLVSIASGVPCGVLAALARGRALDGCLRAAATLGIAVPNFVLASLLVLGFALAWPLFPVAGYGSPRHLVLPALALGLPTGAYVARLVRAGLLEVLAQDFVRAARARGIPERTVVLRHALPAGLLPALSYLGPAAAAILTGSLVVERIFAIPGTGSHFVNGALNRDYTLAMGVTLVYAALVYALNALVDLTAALVDPRLDLEGA
jgi:oligopeptide transport system permease protein